MTSLHERKSTRRIQMNPQQHHSHMYEDIVLDEIQVSHSKDHNEKKKSKGIDVQLPIWAFVVVGLFVIIGLLLGYLLLHHQHRRVILHVIRHPWDHGGAALRIMTTRRRKNYDGFHHHFYSGSPRFVTVVLPSVVNPSQRGQRLEAIHNTWGPYARAIYVLHNSTEFPKAAHLTISEDSLPQDQYLYPQNLLLPSSITFEDGIQRLFHTIRTIYNEKNPDFAFFVNDHTYVIPEHLCQFLEGKRPEDDLYAGHALKNDKVIFNSGAAGYVLSRETMSKLIQKYESNDPACWIDEEKSDEKQKKWFESNPGLVLVACLASAGIKAIDTREQHKYHRFHAFPLVRVVSGQVDEWYTRKHKLDDLSSDWSNDFDPTYSTLLTGPDCCSAATVSFHYIESNENTALFSVRAALLENAKMSDLDLQSIMVKKWPQKQSDIGYYSKGLPNSDEREAWIALLATVRKLSSFQAEDFC